ncbi:cell division protein FtsW [Acetobacteraceae bacterium]|nr:cell division protein FtsW [Candidatus Parcubacteria bacterium]
MKKSIDMPFLLVACVIVVAGLLVFTSAALGLMARGGGVSFASVATNQLLIGFICGGAACFIVSRFDYRLLKPYTPYFFAFAIGLTLLTFTPLGLSLKGASRWVDFGLFSFQPAEILKFATVAFLAAFYSTHMRTVDTWKGGVLPLGVIAGSATLLVLLQPDTASAMMIVAGAVGVLFAAGGKFSHMLILALTGAAIVGIMALSYTHVADRIETFLNQSNDPHGAGWQIQQSLIAIGSGEVFGKGFGQSIQKFSYLPEPMGDSIFAVVGEEFGFFGSVALVAAFIAFGLLALRIASRAPDPFGGLLVVGLTVLIVGQSFFNIASSLGLVPLVGVPLIFVSHGGTALAIALAEVGVILSVSRRMKSSSK